MQATDPQVPAVQSGAPKCVGIAETGITNSQETIKFLSALVADGAAGRVTTGLMHGACNAIGKMLRVVELEARFGTAEGANQERILRFVTSNGNGHAPAATPSPRQLALSKLTREEAAALGVAV